MNPEPDHSAIDATGVAAFLQTHPEFFNTHADLLAGLSLPHPSGTAVSLWERQNAALRDNGDRLRAQLDTFVAHARQNEALVGRLQQLVLAVLATDQAQAMLDLLATRLSDEFQADRVTPLVFAEGREVACMAFVGRDSPRREPFAEVLKRHATLCGRLNQAQRQALFGADALEGSHVVLPLLGAAWDGLLVISSADPARFETSMGTELLGFLRDVVSLVLTPLVAPPRS